MAIKATYEPDSDQLYVSFAHAKIEHSREVAPGVVLDVDADGRIVGIEFAGVHSVLTAGTELVGGTTILR